MAHGTKDYGNVAPKETTYQLTDMAELAVRLGALPSLDRLGDIIFQDDFSNGITNWIKTLTGTGAAISLDTTYFKGGGFSTKFVGGSDSSRSALMYMNFPFPVLSNFGLEWCLTFGTDVAYVVIGLVASINGYYYESYMRVDPVNNNIAYLNNMLNYVQIVSDAKITVSNYFFNSYKLVIDLINAKYKRFCYNSGVVSMSGLDLPKSYYGYPDYMGVVFYIYSKTGLNGISYLDNIIITQNEP